MGFGSISSQVKRRTRKLCALRCLFQKVAARRVLVLGLHYYSYRSAASSCSSVSGGQLYQITRRQKSHMFECRVPKVARWQKLQEPSEVFEGIIESISQAELLHVALETGKIL